MMIPSIKSKDIVYSAFLMQLNELRFEHVEFKALTEYLDGHIFPGLGIYGSRSQEPYL